LRECFGQHLCFHVASSDDDCLGRLSAHDLVKDCLPVIFGGSWTGCSPWRPGYNSQLHLNIEPDPKCLIRNTLWYYIHSRQPPAAVDAAGAVGQNRDGGSNTQLVRVVRKKRSPAASAAADPPAAAGGDVDDDAEEETTMDKKAKIRVQHKIDSRKRRARLKIEEEVFLEQYWKQRNMNEALKAEQQRLEELVQAAENTIDSSSSSS
jgi:hypothetical protein